MAERDIVQNLISGLGQSQDERLPAELRAHFVDVDERTPADLLRRLKRLAPLVQHYRDTDVPNGDWTPFFSYSDQDAELLPQREDGAVPPHLALLTVFARLYEIPRAAINQLTGRHLDFFYRRVLRFEERPAVPDRAHVLIELKKGAAPVALGPGHAFSAGKDAAGVELIYSPIAETVVNASKVESLRSIYLDRTGRGTVRFAPIADSADGLGGALPAAEPKWRAFGHPGLPAAEVGFAVASTVLRMKEGARKVTLTLGLDAAKLTAAAIAASFEVFLTGEKRWLGPYALSPSGTGATVRLELEVPESEPAVIDYDPAVHGYAYAAQGPVLQFLLKPGATLGYEDLASLMVKTVRVEVDVTGVTSLTLESDAGALDPKKAFLPFGPQPVVGSRFLVGSAEAFSKKLSQVRLQLQWQGAPERFKDWYKDYSGGGSINNNSFSAKVAFQDGGSWKYTGSVQLFASPNDGEALLTFPPGSPAPPPPSSAPLGVFNWIQVYTLYMAGTSWAMNEALRNVLAKPVLSSAVAAAPPEARTGYLTLSLERDFLHAAYRKESVENVVKASRDPNQTLVMLNEPYTPTLRAVSLSYVAHSDTADLTSATLDPDVQFFHIGPFGSRREHAVLRRKLGFPIDPRVPLLPVSEHEGELLLGLSGLAAGDSVSLLFQVSEGSADPDLRRQDVEWSVLCDNHWKSFSRSEIARDTANQLLTNGVVGLVIPPEATRENTFLPAGWLWLRAAVRENVNAVSQLIAVAANAVEVQFQDRGNDPAHLLAPLPAESISRLKTPVAAVKTVKQPFASFGGSPVESSEALHTRAAERLRHRNRCITAWDYERMVLSTFPGVHKVKCIPHAKDGLWLAPGHVLVVVVPDLRNRNAVDPLQPKVDADTLDRITGHLQAQAGAQVRVRVKNPLYQQIRLDFKVRFLPGYEFNFYRAQLEQELIRFLSPWAFDATRPISFGGKVYKSVLLDFVEELAPVDFVTDFRMYSSADPLRDVSEIQAATPDAILVSAPVHTIAEAV